MQKIKQYTTTEEEAKKYDIASDLRSLMIKYCCDTIVRNMKDEGYLTKLSIYGNMERIIARSKNRWSSLMNLANKTSSQLGFYTYNNAAEVKAAVAN